MMKVELTNIDDVCSEIKEYADKIWRKTVRMRINENPLDDEGMISEVGLWVTAVVRTEDGDWLLEFGEASGEIYVNDPEEKQREVTDRLAAWRKKIVDVCEDCDLKVRPGKWETW